MRLLFVCTGNTCRSPAAAAIAAAEARRRGLGEIEVSSAGVFAFPGQPAAGVSIVVGRERGLDLGEHRSRELDLPRLEWADLVIGMSRSHVDAVREWRTGVETALLTEYLAPGHPEHGRGVPDPVGGDRTTYEETYDLLESAIAGLFDHLEARRDEGSAKP